MNKFKNCHFLGITICIISAISIFYLGMEVYPYTSPDSMYDYLGMGEKILNNGFIWYFTNYGMAPPLFACLIAGLISLGVPPIEASQLIVVTSFALIIFPVYYIGKELGDDILGILCVLFISTFPLVWVFGLTIWTEILFILFSMTSIVFFIRYYKDNSLLYLILSALFVSLVSLSRYPGIFLVIAGIIIILLKQKFFDDSFNKMRIILFGSISIIPITIILIRNKLIKSDYYAGDWQWIENTGFINENHRMLNWIFNDTIITPLKNFTSLFPPHSFLIFLIFILLCLIFILFSLHLAYNKNVSIELLKILYRNSLSITVFLIVYIGFFLLIYCALQGYGGEQRYMQAIAPLLTIFIIINIYTFIGSIKIKKYKICMGLLFFLILSSIMIGNILESKTLYNNFYQGSGYTSPFYHNNEGIKYLLSSNTSSNIHVNSIYENAVRYQLGRPVTLLPFSSNNNTEIYNYLDFIPKGDYMLILKMNDERVLNKSFISQYNLIRKKFSMLVDYPDSSIFVST